MTIRRGGLVLGMLALLGGAVPARAQDGPQSRAGFWFGLGLGYGSLCGDECDMRSGAGSGHFKLGATVSRRVLVGFESNVWVKDEGGATLSQINGSGVMYFYPYRNAGFHLKAGVGFARATVAFITTAGGTISSTETGVGALLGVGYDVRVARNVSVVPFFNYLRGKYNSGSTNFFQMGLGVTVH